MFPRSVHGPSMPFVWQWVAFSLENGHYRFLWLGFHNFTEGPRSAEFKLHRTIIVSLLSAFSLLLRPGTTIRLTLIFLCNALYLILKTLEPDIEVDSQNTDHYNIFVNFLIRRALKCLKMNSKTVIMKVEEMLYPGLPWDICFQR